MPALALVSPIASAQRTQQYAAPNGQFSLTVPSAANWAGVPYRVLTLDDRGDSQYDRVMLHVDDFGEYVVIGVRTLPDAAAVEMADAPADALRHISGAALIGWRDNFPVEPAVIEESFVETPYGEALMRVYHAERGSMLTVMRGGAPTNAGERFDTHIVSMVVRQGTMVAFVMTQDDGYAVGPRPDAARNIAALKARAEQILLSLTIPAERGRPRRR